MLSRQTIVEQVFNLVKDTTFGLDPAPYVNMALLKISRDRPLIKTDDHLIVSDNVLDQGGLEFDLPTGFDKGRDQIVSVELLDRDNSFRSLNPPQYVHSQWYLYDVSTGTTKLRFVASYDAGEKFRIKYRSEYSFDTQSGSNLPDSLREPVVLYTASQYALAIATRYAQAKTDGLDFINMTENKNMFMELFKTFIGQYSELVKELPTDPAGVVPVRGIDSMPNRMGDLF